MNKKHLFILTGVCLSIFAAYVFINRVSKRDANPSAPRNSSLNSFFYSTPLIKPVYERSLCISVTLGKDSHLLILDTGFAGHMAVTPTILENLPQKTFLQERNMYGIRGTCYKSQIYELDEVYIDPIFFLHVPIEDFSLKFQQDSIILSPSLPTQFDEGMAGWKLFRHSNLLLDFKHQKIAFCDSVHTLHEKGIPIESWTKTPLFFVNDLPHVEVRLPGGPMPCLLDTGCTWNLINDPTLEGSLDDLAKDRKGWTTVDNAVIGDEDFGPITFKKLPIPESSKIQAILGVEFFEKHLVFLNFSKNMAYFAKYSEEADNGSGPKNGTRS